MSTVMNFVCVLGAILIFFLSALGAVVLYVFIKHHDEIQEKKDSRLGSVYTSYSSYADRVNRVIPNTTPYELSQIRFRISELEDKLDGIEEALEIGDYKNNDGEMITTIPEEIQNLRNEVETLTRSVNDIVSNKSKEDSDAAKIDA